MVILPNNLIVFEWTVKLKHWVTVDRLESDRLRQATTLPMRKAFIRFRSHFHINGHTNLVLTFVDHLGCASDAAELSHGSFSEWSKLWRLTKWLLPCQYSNVFAQFNAPHFQKETIYYLPRRESNELFLTRFNNHRAIFFDIRFLYSIQVFSLALSN